MIAVISLSVFSLFFWILTVLTLKGVDWILINGVNILPKEDKKKFKEQYDVIAMNKYVGKNIFLPTAILFSLIVPLVLLDTEWMQSKPVLFGIIIIIVSIAYIVYLVRATLKILDFDRWRN